MIEPWTPERTPETPVLGLVHLTDCIVSFLSREGEKKESYRGGATGVHPSLADSCLPYNPVD